MNPITLFIALALLTSGKQQTPPAAADAHAPTEIARGAEPKTTRPKPTISEVTAAVFRSSVALDDVGNLVFADENGKPISTPSA